MQKNTGKVDKIIRLILGIVFIILGIVHSKLWFIPAAIAIITALMGWCLFYKVCGISTAKDETKPAE